MKLNVPIEDIFKQLNIEIFKIKENFYVLNDESFQDRDIDIEKDKYDGLILYVHELDYTPKRAEIAKITRDYNRKSIGNPVLVCFNYPHPDKSQITSEELQVTSYKLQETDSAPVKIDSSGLFVRSGLLHKPDDNSQSEIGTTNSQSEIGTTKHRELLSFALSERKEYLQDWREGEKVGKIVILRDIDIKNPHRGHLQILQQLADVGFTNFKDLHQKWLEVLDTSLLNKKFYKRLMDWYRLCFDDLKINLEAASKTLNKKIDDELKPQAVIRVIIRLMFIWFMKERGLIKDRLFTREFADEYLLYRDTYYNAILQNLFFAVLNKNIDERRFRRKDIYSPTDPQKNDFGISDVMRYESFFRPNKAQDFLRETATIPFINGGLFTCHDYLFIGYDKVSNEHHNKKNYIIDGFSERSGCRAIISDDVIFQLIDLFNDFVFTIEESTPLEKDIALDPELLGTVFEEIIGHYNPETKETARKQSGSFYTPKEIVDYMCGESFKEYLKSKHPELSDQIDRLVDKHEDYLDFPQKNKILHAITDIKILDPACGSGAFPMGMFALMVRTIEKLHDHKATYQYKLDIIKSCIYGVDIQNIAVEITKLRFFISLLVDAPLPEDIKNFDVLPNLETKFVVADTLMKIDLDFSDNVLVSLSDDFKALTEIFLTFTTAKTPDQKALIKNAFHKKKMEILTKENLEWGENKDKIKNWNPFNISECSPFFDMNIMFGVNDGFDVVIGNPPYISAVTMSRNDEMKKIFKKLYPQATGSYDIYILFLLRAIQILNKNGIYIWIIPNKFLVADYAKNTKNYLLNNFGLKFSIDISNFGVFENTGVYPIIILGIKNYKENFSELLLDNSSDLRNRIFNNATYLKYFKTFKDYNIKIYSGLTGFQAQQIIEFINEKKDDNNIPFIVSGNVDRYFWMNNNVRYMGNKYVSSFISKNDLISESKWEFWSSPKIVIAGMTKVIESVYCEHSLGLGVGIYGIYDFGVFDPYCLTAILNSKFLSYHFKIKFKDKHLAGGYLAVNKSTIEELPLVDISHEFQKKMSYISKKIHLQKRLNSKCDTTHLENEIDRLVYSLYGLSDEEIAIVEGISN